MGRQTGKGRNAVDPEEGKRFQIGLDARLAAAVGPGDGQNDRNIRLMHIVSIARLTLRIPTFIRYVMGMTKDQVTEILTEIATLLELKGENPFKSRAYVNAARAVENSNVPLEKIFCVESTERIKGIGDSLHVKICEMVTTGRLVYYEELKASIPPGLVGMLSIPGLGPKKIKAIYDKLGVETLEQLEKACLEGKVAELDGFGEKSQVKICEGINFRRQYASRHLLGDALMAAEPILENLRSHPEVVRCSMAGRLRRFKEIIGDIDFLASSRQH